MNAQEPKLPDLDLSKYDAVVFDLGGVILPLEYGATIRELSQLFGIDASTIYTQARQSDLFDAFERGEIKSSEFRQQLFKHAGFSQSLDASHINDSTIDTAWNALLGHIPSENVEFLRRLALQKRTFLLSNTNEIHLAQFVADFESDHPHEGTFASLFERAYYSHEMKMRKPESRIYQTLLDNHQLTPESTLFLDDNPDNVKGARAVGIHAEVHLSNSKLPARFFGMKEFSS